MTWTTYCAVDISATMLERFIEYRNRSRPRPGEPYPICSSADSLPLEDDSIDLAITSAVFLHMGKSFSATGRRDRADAEARRRIVFDVSFPKLRNPPSFLPRLKPVRFRPPHFLKYWTRARSRRCWPSPASQRRREDSGSRRVLCDPAERIGTGPLPLTRRANRAVQSPPSRFDELLAESFLVYSSGVDVQAFVTGGGGFLGSSSSSGSSPTATTCSRPAGATTT